MMSYKKKTILIIGGCGYIGSSLYLYFKNKKYSVDTVDLEWFGNFVNRNNKKINYNRLTKKALSVYDVIILLAGYSSIAMCEEQMLDSFQNNVVNFVGLLNKIENQIFIYASTSGIYGNTKQTLVDEAYDRYTPVNFYDLTKKEIDYYASLSGKRYYGLRLGTVNGWSPNLRIDIMINKMYDSTINTGIIEIYNENVYRPILGISDLCKAIETITVKKVIPGIYNIASFNLTIKQIVEKVANSIGKVILINKGIKKTYNFSINTSKFQKQANFRFVDTVESIINSLHKNYDKSHKSKRGHINEKKILPML